MGAEIDELFGDGVVLVAQEGLPGVGAVVEDVEAIVEAAGQNKELRTAITTTPAPLRITYYEPARVIPHMQCYRCPDAIIAFPEISKDQRWKKHKACMQA